MAASTATACATDDGKGLPEPAAPATTAVPALTAGGNGPVASTNPPAVPPLEPWLSLPALPEVSADRLTGEIGDDGTYDLGFPVLRGPGLTPAVNAGLRAPADRARALFAADLLEDEAPDPEPSHLFGGGSVSFVDTRVASAEYDLTVEWGGAASGDQRVDTVVVDLADGSVLGPLDLFYDDSPWLESLSAVVQDDLEQRFGTDAVWAVGLLPEAANFEHLALYEGGVVVRFDSYQVGPGVLGAPRVTVPWSAVGAYIDPRGPVGHLVAGG